jgi:AcrR family transcriptional regulator
MVPRKANTPTLTRDQIVSAAMKLVDEHGLDALSMRKLAAELGVGTMSVYYHVPDKSALYDLILDAGLAEVDLSDDDPSEPAEVRVRRIAYAFRTALLNHPHAAILAMSRSLRTPTQLRPVERMLQILTEAGLPPAEAMQAVNVIGQYAVGVTTMSASQLGDSEYRDEREGDYGALTPEEFPNMFRMMQYADQFGDWNADFDAGLAALIKGLVTERVP